MAKAEKHLIKLEDIDHVVWTQQLAGSFGHGEDKELVMKVVGRSIFYQVYDHKKLSMETIFIKHAVERYNEI